MRQINPDVVAVYPITPQSQIAQDFSKLVADGKVATELINVESEHSALSAVVGASAAGARAMTATASQGLALMGEVVPVVSGLRLPVVVTVPNRALSGPINIHCDYSDSMMMRDMSWIQVYSATPQEAYDHTLIALRLAEEIRLPVMNMMDGFITSHCVERVEVLEDKDAKKFIGEAPKRRCLLNFDDPITLGPLQLTDSLFETKIEQHEAMKKVPAAFKKISDKLSKLTGSKYGTIESYRMNDAEAAIVVLASLGSTAKAVVDKLREEGKKVGLIRVRMFRPFPYKEVEKAIEGTGHIAVFDRSFSFGAHPPLFSEICNAVLEMTRKPRLQSCVFGIGGREILEKDIEKVFKDLLSYKVSDEMQFIGAKK
ncbi:MAG: pyruvate ferredoxin oxidoreductase [Candidatus Woesearchaeota archaeon]